MMNNLKLQALLKTLQIFVLSVLFFACVFLWIRYPVIGSIVMFILMFIGIYKAIYEDLKQGRNW